MISIPRHWTYSTLLVVLLASLSCSGEDEQFDRNEMLTDIGQQTITQANDEMREAADGLRDDVGAFCDDPDQEGLQAARETWLQIKEPLKNAEAFAFGPYRMPQIQIAMNADKWPGRGDNVEAIIEGDETIDQEFVAGLDYRERTKGYPAIGYLLYGAPDGAETLEAYTTDEYAPERRCDYLVAAAEQGYEIVDSYHQRWATDGDGYIDELTGAGEGSDAFPSTQDAVTDLMGAMLFALDEISLMKLATPAGLGEDNDGEPAPDQVEAPYSQTSVDHALWALDGVEAIYLGDGDGLALTDYVQFRESAGEVDQTVRDRLEAARTAIDEIPRPLSEAVQDDPEAVEEAIDRVDELNQALGGEVSTLLGINPTTVEGDND